jgi:hypothetical protein
MPSAAIATKLDLYAANRPEYITPKKPVLIQTRPAVYLTINGAGEPGNAVFQAAIGALYAVAFTMKMANKFAGRDYKVCGLEGLWWGSSAESFMDAPRESWQWKLLIRTPDFITREELAQTIEKLRQKEKPAEVSQVKLETLDEGRSIQVLHVGPYSEEPKTIAAMEEFAAAHGLCNDGRHHEIYLSDPRRSKPEKLRTILRQPVR